MQFFDVEADPPKNSRPTKHGELRGKDGRPRRLLSYAELKWADGEEEPLEIERSDEDTEG